MQIVVFKASRLSARIVPGRGAFLALRIGRVEIRLGFNRGLSFGRPPNAWLTSAAERRI